MNEYLASSGDSDDENDSIDEENDCSAVSPSRKLKRKGVHEQRAALLLSGDASDKEESNDEDMEITFNTELEDLSKRILEKKDKKSETVWEAVLRKRSEKRKARRNRSKHSEDDSSDYDTEEDAPDMSKEDAPDMSSDFFMEEPNDSETIKISKKKSKSKKRGEHVKVDSDLRDIKKEQEASRAELELLLADDQGSNKGPKGYNMKRTKVKGKKGKEVALEDKIPDIDVSKDPRFSALVTSHMYALDPTDPEYKRLVGYCTIDFR